MQERGEDQGGETAGKAYIIEVQSPLHFCGVAGQGGDHQPDKDSNPQPQRKGERGARQAKKADQRP